MKMRILSILLALSMTLSLLPIQAIAAEMDSDGTELLSPVTADEESETPRELETPEGFQPNKEPLDEYVKQEVPEETDSEPTLYTSTVAYPVIGGNLYFDPNTGAITDCDESVTSAVIPNSIDGVAVTSIRLLAFSGCDGLTSVTIPSSFTSIADSTFASCTSLTNITIPNSVTSIGQSAFLNCSSLTNVIIPNSVTSIGDAAFCECKSLTSITIPSSVTSIGWRVFGDCSSLTSITIPSSVTSIGDRAFSQCSSLTSIAIPNSVTSIGEYAFSGCHSLISITIPNSVTCIGQHAFVACRGLRSVTIPDSVTSIGEETFYGCEELTSVTISNSVTAIGKWAFANCFKLTNVFYSGAKADWSKISIDNSNHYLLNATIHYNSEWLPEGISFYPEPGSTLDFWTDSYICCTIKFSSQVEAGIGNIYLREYESGKIIRVLDRDASDGNFFLVQDNVVSFNLSLDETFPCGHSFYFTMDADAVKVLDGSAFEGIHRKDTWSFSTAFGLTRRCDYPEFLNSQAHFFSDYASADSSYPIRAALYRRQIERIIGKNEFEKRSKTGKKKDKEFGGSCYGISIVTALYKMGMLNPTEFDREARTLYGLKLPKDSTEPYGVRDLVNYYYMLQFVDGYGIIGTDTLYANFFRDRTKFADAVKGLVEQGLDMDTSQTVLVLSFGWTDGIDNLFKAHQHAVVVCSARKTDSGGYELLIKDPNAKVLTTMQVSADFSSLTYNDQDVVIIKTLDVTTLPSEWLIHGKTVLSGDPTLALLEDTTRTHDILKVVTYGNFTITNSSGETLVFENGYLNGTMEILGEDFVESGVEDYAEFVYYVSKSDGYTFQSADSRASCTLLDGEQYLSVSAENADSITLNKAEGIFVQGINLVYDACATTVTGANMFAVSGETGSNLEISLASDGSAEITADSMENVTFQSLYDDTSFIFDSRTNTAKVVETDQGSLTLDGVEIHEQTRFSTSLRDAGDYVEATVTNNTAVPQTATVLIAVYQPSGQFVRTDIKKLAFEGNQALTFALTESNVEFKLFVTDDLGNWGPIGGSAKFNVGGF